MSETITVCHGLCSLEMSLMKYCLSHFGYLRHNENLEIEKSVFAMALDE